MHAIPVYSRAEDIWYATSAREEEPQRRYEQLQCSAQCHARVCQCQKRS